MTKPIALSCTVKSKTYFSSKRTNTVHKQNLESTRANACMPTIRRNNRLSMNTHRRTHDYSKMQTKGTGIICKNYRISTVTIFVVRAQIFGSHRVLKSLSFDKSRTFANRRSFWPQVNVYFNLK